MHAQSPTALRRALRPPRAGAADGDRAAMRAALRRALDRYKDDPRRLAKAGYASSEDFARELAGLIASSSEQLTPQLMTALFGESRNNGSPATGGRLGRLLGAI